jgi:hypothetical protein
MWRENWVGNCGLGEVWNGYEMLVGKGEGKLLEGFGIHLALRGQILMQVSKVCSYFSYTDMCL